MKANPEKMLDLALHWKGRKVNFHATNMEDAFDYCRECDRPVVVTLEGKDGMYKLYPSGTAYWAPNGLSAFDADLPKEAQ